MQIDADRSPRATVLVTPRLRVTTWLPTDLADLRTLHADPDAMRYMNSGVEDELQTQARLDAYHREQVVPGWTKWRVEDANAAMVGRAGFKLADNRQHRALGYLLVPSLWGNGLATELALALTQWHFDHPDPALRSDLHAYVVAENSASRRVLEKVGFTFVGERIDRGAVRACYVASSRR